MSQNNSTPSHPPHYTYETETHLHTIPISSTLATIFQTLSTGPEKIQFLIKNGNKTIKQHVPGDPAIMQRERGAWRFYNVGQIEYMFLADGGDGRETEAEREYKGIEGVEEKRRFFGERAERIREWPERVRRVENLV